MTLPSLSLVLPTYQERDNIGPLLDGCGAVLEGRDYELLVIDDDSPDGTAEVAARRAASDPRVRVIVRREERGLTSAIRRGVAEARCELVGWMDTDGSMEPRYLPELLVLVDGGDADVVVGSRFVAGGGIKGQRGGAKISWLATSRNLKGTEDSLVAVIFSYFGNWLLERVLTPSFHDWTSGFIVSRREVLEAIPLEGDYGEYFLAFIYRALGSGRRVREVPYVIVPRLHGTSKTGENVLEYLARGRQYLSMAARVRREVGALGPAGSIRESRTATTRRA